MNKILKNKYLIASLVGVVTFIVYLPALRNDFINWDDHEYVYENTFIRSLDIRLLKAAFLSFHASNWHPLTWISHAIDYSIWGLNPLGHHLTNNILHALNTVMVVFLVIKLMEVRRKTEGNNGLSQSFLNDRTILVTGTATGLLFGIHPLHVESVAWISERKDLLCAFFFLLSIFMYIRYAGAASVSGGRPFLKRQYLLTLGFFTLALLSKPMAVTLPFILMMLDWYFFRRIQSLKTFWTAFVEKLPLFALALISSILTILAQRGAILRMQSVPLSMRVFVGAQSLITYLQKITAPVNLVPFYPYPEDISPLSLGYIVPIVLVAGITATCLSVMKKHKLWLLAWGYFVITLIPVIGIIQVGGQSMADRYTYLPSLGPFLIVGLIAAKVSGKAADLNRQRVILRIAGLLIVLAMLISISYATIGQIGIWKNSVALWTFVIEKEPGRVPVAHNNLGDAYASKGLYDMAIEQYQIALKLKPDYADAYNNRGLAYVKQGRIDEAINEYQTVLKFDPDYANTHNNLGLAYAKQGRLDEAIKEYQTALKLNPTDVKPRNNLGIAYGTQGQINEAIKEIETALKLNPDFAETRYNLGVAYGIQGRTDEAIKEYQIAIKLKPDYTDAHFNLGVAYGIQGRTDEAIKEYQIAIKLKPDAADSHYNLGLAYESQGRIDEAIKELKIALKINPDFAQTRQHLDLLLKK